MTLRQFGFCLALVSRLSVYPMADPAGPAGLVWNPSGQGYEAKRGETNLGFNFQFANASTNQVIVRAVRASCDCTTARMPFALPATILPGESGQMQVKVDLHDRKQPFKQTITIETSAGTNRVTLDIKTPELTTREKERLAAFADRQAVFKGDCARCHLQPGLGKSVDQQFKVWCGTCHDSPARAEMVPDLAGIKAPMDRPYWERWIRRGKPSTFMPAFAKPWGGPLSDDEIRTLINWLLERYPPKSTAAAP